MNEEVLIKLNYRKFPQLSKLLTLFRNVYKRELINSTKHYKFLSLKYIDNFA